MLTNYMRAAMHQAHYEMEEGLFYGEISGFSGVLAQGRTLEECRDELESVLEGWILLGVRLGHELPIVNGIDLNVRLAA